MQDASRALPPFRQPVALIVGTRPEAIKLAAVAVALAETCWARPTIVTTGQHGEVVRETLGLFDLKADVELTLSTDSDGLAALGAGLLSAVDGALERIQPTLVVVQGDTASTLAGAQAAFFRQIPVAHVEAGLRTGDMALPFPEEANRRMVSQLTRLHLAPTAKAVRNLRQENVAADDILLTGNTVVDALIMARDLRPPYDDPDLEALDASGAPMVLVTAHRRESWGEPIRQIGRAVARLSRSYPAIGFVVAAHMNPAVRDVVEAEVRDCPNVYLPGPIGYGPFIRLLARATLVITDSGGIQEEAPAFGVPVLVTRDVTERTESIDAGVAKLVGTDEELIVESASRLLADPVAHASMAQATNPYGDGRAAHRVAEGCGWLFQRNPRPIDFSPVPTCDGHQLASAVGSLRNWPGAGSGLSQRESEVLQLMTQGMDNRHIAMALFISGETVKSHVKAVLRKLAARDRTHGVVIALRGHMVS